MAVLPEHRRDPAPRRRRLRWQLGPLALFALMTVGAFYWYSRGSPRATIHVGNCQVFAVAFSPDGLTLAIGDGDGFVRLWGSDGSARTARRKAGAGRALRRGANDVFGPFVA